MRDHGVKNTVLSEVTVRGKLTSTKQYIFNPLNPELNPIC